MGWVWSGGGLLGAGSGWPAGGLKRRWAARAGARGWEQSLSIPQTAAAPSPSCPVHPIPWLQQVLRCYTSTGIPVGLKHRWVAQRKNGCIHTHACTHTDTHTHTHTHTHTRAYAHAHTHAHTGIPGKRGVALDTSRPSEAPPPCAAD